MKIWVDVSCSFLVEAEDHGEAIEKVQDIIDGVKGQYVSIEGTDEYEEEVE